MAECFLEKSNWGWNEQRGERGEGGGGVKLIERSRGPDTLY